MYDNEIVIEMDSRGENESFARIATAGFLSPKDPYIADIVDIKTAVSEAVTNAIIHGYENTFGKIILTLRISGDLVTISVKDFGVGIEDIETAKEPLYTSKPEMERSGMGFSVMESFMDSCVVKSEKGTGTEIVLTKTLSTKGHL